MPFNRCVAPAVLCSLALLTSTSAAGLAAQPQVAIDPEPIARVGYASGHEFGFVQAAGVVGDRFFVVDGTSQDVRVFELDGRPAGRFGRSGQGPFEFSGLVGAQVVGDTILLLDASNRRVTAISAEGHLWWEQPLTGLPFIVGELLRLSDGTWVARRQDRFTGSGSPGLRRDTVQYFRLSPELRSPAVLAEVPGAVSTRWTSRGRTFSRTAPFTPRPKAAAFGRCVFVTSTDSAVVEGFDSDGGRVETIRFSATSRPVSDSIKAIYVDLMTERISPEEDRRAARREAMERLPTPSHLPVSQSLYTDELGFLWLQRFEPVFRGTEAWVIPPDFSTTIRVRLPEPMRILHVGGGYLVGLVYGALEQQYVHVFAVDRAFTESQSVSRCRV